MALPPNDTHPHGGDLFLFILGFFLPEIIPVMGWGRFRASFVINLPWWQHILMGDVALFPNPLSLLTCGSYFFGQFEWKKPGMDHFGQLSECFGIVLWFFLWPNTFVQSGVGCDNTEVLVFLDFTLISELKRARDEDVWVCPPPLPNYHQQLQNNRCRIWATLGSSFPTFRSNAVEVMAKIPFSPHFCSFHLFQARGRILGC